MIKKFNEMSENKDYIPHGLQPEKYAKYLIDKFGTPELALSYLTECEVLLSALPYDEPGNSPVESLKEVVRDTVVEVYKLK